MTSIKLHEGPTRGKGGWLAGQRGQTQWSSGAYPTLDPGPMVLVDTREQAPLTPWLIKNGRRFRLATTRATLETADYTIAGLEAHVAIERKSLPDLIFTLFGATTDSVGERDAHQDRFREELTRMRSHAFRMLLIEGSRADIWKRRYRSSVEPIEVMNLVDGLMMDYSVNVVWAGNATEAGRILGYLLLRLWGQAQPNSKAAKKASARGVRPHLPWCAGATPGSAS